MTHQRGRTGLRRAFWAALVLASVGVTSPAVRAAEPSSTQVEGYVVALENGDVVVDVAGKRGAAVGDVIELWRPLELRHPVTKKLVKDRFRIGSLRLTQVRDALSLARPEGKLARPPEAGDVVVLHRAALEKVEPTKEPSGPPTAIVAPSAPTSQPSDPDEAEVSRLFDALKNSDVPTRIAAYDDYVRRHPDGRFAAVLWEESAQLRRLLQLEREGAGPEPISAASFAPPKTALAGVPLSIGVELRGPARGAVLHSRNAGEVAYASTPLQAAGHDYWVTEIPAGRVRAPGLEMFIEATDAAGKAVSVVGSADEPQKVDVERIPAPTPPLRPEATASVWTDYADYNRMKGNDRVWQTEGFVGMRFDDEGVRALRTGFGVFRGVGGSLEELDEQGKSGRKVGLTYGYLEGEYAFSSFTALVVRGVVGLKDDGVAGGAQGLVRLGSDKTTNLMIGGEVLGGIGLRGITQLELKTFERVPILFRTEVTNQPAGTSVSEDEVRPETPNALPQDTSTQKGEVGARAIIQVGYEVMPGLVVAGRGSYQGRTIKHAGPGFGGAVTYTW
ncbi:MAG: hypothetical protein KC776_16355 [Myxococcales bacterium]|nr:hypothetical protein [Myxococcales bacterium]